MGMFDEIRDEAMQTGALLGAVLSFAVLFWMYTISIWLIVGLALVIGAIFVVVKLYWR